VCVCIYIYIYIYVCLCGCGWVCVCAHKLTQTREKKNSGVKIIKSRHKNLQLSFNCNNINNVNIFLPVFKLQCLTKTERYGHLICKHKAVRDFYIIFFCRVKMG